MPRIPSIPLLLTRINVPAITPASSCGPVTSCCHLIFQTRTLTSTVERYATPADHPPPWAAVREMVRPSAMWLIPAGSRFDQQQVLGQLPRLDQQGDELPVVLILATPKLAHLFQNDHSFHSRMINTIYGTSVRDSIRQSIVAIVDALPVLGGLRAPHKPEVHGTEGIAVCISPGFDVEPAGSGDSRQPLLSMTARHPFFDGRRYVTLSWSGGVANTTFVNGQQYTLFMQSWSAGDGPDWMPASKQQSLSHVDVHAYANRDDSNFLSVVWYSNMIKLTDPKVILSSMGNIVRQVQGPDGQELAASHELETIVPDKLKELRKTIPTGDLRVFALVYPQELGSQDVFKDRVWGKNPKQTDIKRRRYNTNLLTLLTRGARLYRVTSGGAGWGKKAGLLALEPVTELGGPITEPDFPTFMFNDTEDIRMPGSADLFPPGHVIQFLGTFHDTEGLSKDAISIDTARKKTREAATDLADWQDPEKGQQFCLGNTVLPEIHQNTFLEDVSDSSAEGDPSAESPSTSLIFRPNRFGFLTTSALGLSAMYHSPSRNAQARMKHASLSLAAVDHKANYKHTSLIELPNSYFLTKFAAGGRVAARAAKYYTGSELYQEHGENAQSMTLTNELTMEQAIFLASRKLREAEKVLNESYLARNPVSTRKVATQSSRTIRNITSQLSAVRKYGIAHKQGLIPQHVRATEKEDHSFTGDEAQQLENSSALSPRAARRLKRHLKYTAIILARGGVAESDVDPDAKWRRIPQTLPSERPLTDADQPFRYTVSMPEELSEIFTNESSDSVHRWVESHIYTEDLMAFSAEEFDPENGFVPFSGMDPDFPLRRTISVLQEDRADLSVLLQTSAVFRATRYGVAEADYVGVDETIRSREDRETVEALLKDL